MSRAQWKPVVEVGLGWEGMGCGVCSGEVAEGDVVEGA